MRVDTLDVGKQLGDYARLHETRGVGQAIGLNSESCRVGLESGLLLGKLV